MGTPSGMLTKDEQAIQTALNGLEQQISSMITSGQTVERINAEVSQAYVSGASTAFQSNIADWIQRYQKVMQAFQHLTDSTAGANQVLNRAEEDAHVIGGNWGGGSSTSNHVTSVLNPK